MKSLHLSEAERSTLVAALRCLQACRERTDRDLPVEPASITSLQETQELLDAERIDALIGKITGSAPASIHSVITVGLSALCAATGATSFASLDGAIAHAEEQIRDWRQTIQDEDEIDRLLAEFNALDENGRPQHFVRIGDCEEVFIASQELRD